MTRRRSSDDPIRIDAALAEVTGELGAASIDALTEIGERIAEWLGPELAPLVSTRSLVGDELVLEVADTRVASELRYRREELAARLVAAGLQTPIRRVRVAVARGH